MVALPQEEADGDLEGKQSITPAELAVPLGAGWQCWEGVCQAQRDRGASPVGAQGLPPPLCRLPSWWEEQGPPTLWGMITSPHPDCLIKVAQMGWELVDDTSQGWPPWWGWAPGGSLAGVCPPHPQAPRSPRGRCQSGCEVDHAGPRAGGRPVFSLSQGEVLAPARGVRD